MESSKLVVLTCCIAVCVLSSFTSSAAVRPDMERVKLRAVLSRLDGILDNLIEENNPSHTQLAKDFSPNSKRNEDGSVPYKRNEDGSVPYKRNEDGFVPYKRNEDGSVPYKRNEDGSIPYKRAHLRPKEEDVSLHDVLAYLLSLNENMATIPDKRDHGY